MNINTSDLNISKYLNKYKDISDTTNKSLTSLNKNIPKASNSNIPNIQLISNKVTSIPSGYQVASNSQIKSFDNFANSYGVNPAFHQQETNDLGLTISNNGVSLNNYAVPSTYTSDIGTKMTTISNTKMLRALGYNAGTTSVVYTNVYDISKNPLKAPVKTYVSTNPLYPIESGISNFFDSLYNDLKTLGNDLFNGLDWIYKYWYIILLAIAGIAGIYLYISHEGREKLIKTIKGE
jgi:hypothetical protein